jgi:protein TonB
VFVSFIVNRDGSVSDVKVERGVDPLLDNEVVRMVENMPKWTPGKQRGQAVRVAYTFPVIFNLDKK